MTLYLLFATLLIAASFYGWGSIVRYGLRLETPRPLNLGLGVGIVIVFGGWAARVQMAGLMLIYGLLFGGVVFSVLDVIKLCRSRPRWVQARAYLGVMVSAPVVFWAHHRPLAFNIHDDIEKYLKYPVRLLTTGGLQTGPYDSLGSATLGAMSFLQTFAVATGPIAFVNVIDDVIGQLGCALIVVGIGQRVRAPWLLTVIVSLLVIAIDPLKANVSASYLGTLLVLTLLGVLMTGPAQHVQVNGRQAVAAGLACAGLVALKSSLALVLPILFGTILVVGWWLGPARVRLSRELLMIPFAALLLAGPWFAIHAEKYAAMLSSTIAVESGGERVSPVPAWEPFSPEAMEFGFSVGHIHYTSWALLVLGWALAVGLGSKTVPQRHRWVGLSLGSGAAITYLVGQWWGAPQIFGYDHGLRYQIPILLAAAATLVVMADPSAKQSAGKNRIALVVATVTLLSFVPSTWHRYEQAGRLGFSLAMPERSWTDFLEYHAFLQSTEAQAMVQQIQTTVPAGKRVLVWTNLAAFRLDYARNQIWDVDPAGIAAPWNQHPFGDAVEAQTRHLLAHGVDCIIWQYAGPGVRTDAYYDTLISSGYGKDRTIFGRTKAFRDFLRELGEDRSLADVIYDDGLTRVFRLKAVE